MIPNIAQSSDDEAFEDLYGTILPNPDKFDNNDSDIMLEIPCSSYYTIEKFNKAFSDCGSNKNLTLLHCNIRSLPKNIDSLNNLL